ncbi:hypothetical protein, partial [Salmonella enterica]|uniref:hypothetical protein n=1 Tax=Salmonella enterica TaxID=28901 RepID=UPI001C376092
SGRTTVCLAWIIRGPRISTVWRSACNFAGLRAACPACFCRNFPLCPVVCVLRKKWRGAGETFPAKIIA